MISKLEEMGVVCCSNRKTKSLYRKPTPAFYNNISILLKILDLIVTDWELIAVPNQEIIDQSKSEIEAFQNVSKAFINLQSYYLKCLFSYALFFCSLKNVYDNFFRDLNEINNKSCFRVKRKKKPRESDYIKKVRNIRNLAIAHIGSKKTKLINSKAAMTWQPMVLGKKVNGKWDINQIVFGSGKWSSVSLSGETIDQQTIDLKITSIYELHSNCSEYLIKYDEICSNYLDEIIKKLPVSDDDCDYYLFK